MFVEREMAGVLGSEVLLVNDFYALGHALPWQGSPRSIDAPKAAATAW